MKQAESPVGTKNRMLIVAEAFPALHLHQPCAIERELPISISYLAKLYGKHITVKSIHSKHILTTECMVLDTNCNRQPQRQLPSVHLTTTIH